MHVFVGGHDGTSGATWHYTHPTTYGSTVVLPTLWASGGVGPNPKPYGPSAGLNDQVFDALVVLAAGAWSPEAIARGYAAIERLQADMDQARQRRLTRLGFPVDEAAALSALHTRNFM